MATKHKIKDAVKALEAAGYVVKRKAQFAKKTFEVEKNTLVRFVQCQQTLGIRMKDAISQALEEWVEKNVQK